MSLRRRSVADEARRRGGKRFAGRQDPGRTPTVPSVVLCRAAQWPLFCGQNSPQCQCWAEVSSQNLGQLLHCFQCRLFANIRKNPGRLNALASSRLPLGAAIWRIIVQCDKMFRRTGEHRAFGSLRAKRENRRGQPHTSLAVSTASLSFIHCSSSARMLPSSVLAKPHCGLRQS